MSDEEIVIVGFDKPCKRGKGEIDKDGYIRVIDWSTGSRRRIRKHRLEWEKHNGPIPDGVEILHHCDNTWCYEITHLFSGSQADNMKDKTNKGRQNKGESHGMSYLSEEDVLEIRERYVKNSRRTGSGALAREFNVSRYTIFDIVTRRSWRHI